MKKSFLLIILSLALFSLGVKAQLFQVEKAFKVKVADRKLSSGMSINENDIVNIDNNGFLLLVDEHNKKRYYINYPCRSKIGNLIKKDKSPMVVTKAFLDAILTSQRRNTDYASAGNVIRGENEEELLSIGQECKSQDKESLSENSIPSSIEINPNLIDGEMVTLYIVLP